MFNVLNNLAIRKKLILSMACSLLIFLGISSILSVTMSGSGIRDRVIGTELPAQVGEIRNDILRQIEGPLAISERMDENAFLLNWEAAGLPNSGDSVLGI